TALQPRNTRKSSSTRTRVSRPGWRRRWRSWQLRFLSIQATHLIRRRGMTRIRGAGLVALLLSLPLLSAVPAHADTPCATSQGYRFIGSDGGIFAYGAADFRGSASGVISTAAVGVAST